MKQAEDKKTQELPLSRQAAYRQRLQESGKIQMALWVTPAERQAVMDLLAQMRSEKRQGVAS